MIPKDIRQSMKENGTSVFVTDEITEHEHGKTFNCPNCGQEFGIQMEKKMVVCPSETDDGEPCASKLVDALHDDRPVGDVTLEEFESQNKTEKQKTRERAREKNQTETQQQDDDTEHEQSSFMDW